MSLANVLAVSQAAKTVVLIGDPQQLDQPTKGSHPDGTDASALDHILGGEPTIPAIRDCFSKRHGGCIRRSAPTRPNCSMTASFVQGTGLISKPSRADLINGSGLYLVPVAHSGNQNCSPEEAKAVENLVSAILNSKATWVDRDGQEKSVTLNDVIIITPYNAQVFEIQQCLPGARVGTVDKFQGQEAPIAIYSTATRQAMRMRRVGWSFSTASTGSTSQHLAQNVCRFSSAHQISSRLSAAHRDRCN